MSNGTDTFVFGFHTDPGPRETNQDTVLNIELPDGRWLLAIADGMGGLAEGELASKTALKALFKGLSDGDSLPAAIHRANSAVFDEAQGRIMGTTLATAVFSGTSAEIASVGDSRVYQLDPFGLVQITRDHTVARDAPDGSGALGLDPASARWAGALARSIGAEQTVDVDVFGPLHVQEGGWILLSSDGLHDVLSTSDMESVLETGLAPAEAARSLVEQALERNTGDNVSVALAFRPEAGLPAAQAVDTVFQAGTKEDEGAPEQNEPLLESDQDLGGSVTETTDAPEPWNPQRFVARARHAREPKPRILLAISVSALMILLVVLLLVVFNWTLNPGTG